MTAATSAKPTPVLPLVGSISVPPGLSAPDASAASTIASAMRSLTDPPGLKYSTLATTSAAPLFRLRMRTSGVFPTSSVIFSWMFGMLFSFWFSVFLHWLYNLFGCEWRGLYARAARLSTTKSQLFRLLFSDAGGRIVSERKTE